MLIETQKYYDALVDIVLTAGKMVGQYFIFVVNQSLISWLHRVIQNHL